MWNYSESFFIVAGNAKNQVPIFAITNTKLYVPVVTLSTQDNAKLLQQIKKQLCFLKKQFNQLNKYQLEPILQTRNPDLNYLIDPRNHVENRLFILSFKNNVHRTTQSANIGPQDVPRTSYSTIPRMSPKDPISPSRRRPELTSQVRPEMKFRRRPNLTSKDFPRTSPRGPSEYSNLDAAKFILTFLSEIIRLTKSI